MEKVTKLQMTVCVFSVIVMGYAAAWMFMKTVDLLAQALTSIALIGIQ